MIRFHRDENVPHAIARGLRLRGIDVTTTVDARLQGVDDHAQIAYGLREARVILTQDDDFSKHRQAGLDHAGIVYSKQGTRTIGEVVRYLKLTHDCLDEEDMVGQLKYF